MRWKVIKPIRDSMENKYQWVIAAVPGKAWAKKVFPGERTSTATEKLWENILYTSRVNASIFPKKDLGEKSSAVIQMISTHMPPRKVKIRS